MNPMKESNQLSGGHPDGQSVVACPLNPALVASVIAILRQGEWLLEQLDNEQYVC